MSDQQQHQGNGHGSRPESDGPDKPQPPATSEPSEAPASPEKTPDVHGHPEPPA
jgi:hypothetical protein